MELEQPLDRTLRELRLRIDRLEARVAQLEDQIARGRPRYPNLPRKRLRAILRTSAPRHLPFTEE